MQSYQLTLKPLSAFATPLYGDTLFGQLCWAIRNRYGEDRLIELLQGYTEQRPFAIVSNAFPEGYLPLPKLPGYFYNEVPGQDRKAVKKLTWLPLEALDSELPSWLQQAKSDSQLAEAYQEKGYSHLVETHTQAHNSINRLTGTTGEGFAPYNMSQQWFHPKLKLHCYLHIDQSRIDLAEIQQCLEDIGQIGYGKDASIGMGKYEIEAFKTYALPIQASANACLTLAPCAPQGQGYDSANSYYQMFTRFGRHGDSGVHKDNKPFKNPVLLAQAGAIFSMQLPDMPWIGQGIGGNGELSKSIPQTVQQGYAPYIAIKLPA